MKFRKKKELFAPRFLVQSSLLNLNFRFITKLSLNFMVYNFMFVHFPYFRYKKKS